MESVDYNNHLRIHIKSPKSHQIHELKNHSCSLLGIDSNYIKNNKKTTFVVESKDGEIWKQISSEENCRINVKLNPLSHLP